MDTSHFALGAGGPSRSFWPPYETAGSRVGFFSGNAASERSVVTVTGTLHFCPIVCRPIYQDCNRIQQALSQLRQVVFDARRNGWVHGSGDQTVALHGFQCEREHPLRDTFDPVAQFAEALSAVPEHAHDLHAPFVTYAVQDFADGETFGGIMPVTQ
jgi:hypothetical protein